MYTCYFSLTWGAIQAARQSGRTTEEFGIYSEDIVHARIRGLSNPSSFKKATCGVDSHHYGRYLLRGAATRGQDDRTERAPALEPFVLTKVDVRISSIPIPFTGPWGGLLGRAASPKVSDSGDSV